MAKGKMEMTQEQAQETQEQQGINVYAAASDVKQQATKAAKIKIWELGSKLYPTSYFLTQTKQGSFFADLLGAVYASPKRSGQVVIEKTDGTTLTKNLILTGNTTEEIGKNYAAFFYDELIPDVIAAAGQITVEVVEKKKLCRPASVRFTAD
jgi:hypothetical protein